MLVISLMTTALVVMLLGWLVAGGPRLPSDIDRIIDEAMRSDLSHVVAGETGYATSQGLRIWYEHLHPHTPPKGTVLLVLSQGADALMWPPAFVRLFVEAGYRVVRFDHRGTGMSDRVEAWDRRSNAYTLNDMAGDAVAVLDALDVRRAHVVGLSMGGMIAQVMAIEHPSRVASLALLSTSGDPGDPELPGLKLGSLLATVVTSLPLVRYRLLGGERNLVKERIAKAAAYGVDGMDPRETAEVVLYDLRHRRGTHVAAVAQHFVAITISGARHAGLRAVDVPTLVVHGRHDPLLPLEHGAKLAASIRGARTLWLDAGHVLPYPDMPRVNAALLDHLADAAARESQRSSTMEEPASPPADG